MTKVTVERRHKEFALRATYGSAGVEDASRASEQIAGWLAGDRVTYETGGNFHTILKLANQVAVFEALALREASAKILAYRESMLGHLVAESMTQLAVAARIVETGSHVKLKGGT